LIAVLLLSALMVGSTTGSAGARTANVEILKDHRLDRDEQFESVAFVVKKKQGRAAVKVELTDGLLYDFERRSFTVPVEGLHYDRDQRQVRWEINGTSVVCAHYSRAWGTIRETGRCPFEIEKKLVVDDDGWKETRYHTLSVRMSAP
jgi:hypothetical protein